LLEILRRADQLQLVGVDEDVTGGAGQPSAAFADDAGYAELDRGLHDRGAFTRVDLAGAPVRGREVDGGHGCLLLSSEMPVSRDRPGNPEQFEVLAVLPVGDTVDI